MSPRCCLWTTRPPLPPGGEGAALMMGDPQRWPLACGLASAAASPWVRGGCALGKGKVRISDGHKSKDITDAKSYGNGFIRLGGISALCPCWLLTPGWEGEVPVRGKERGLVALLPRSGQSSPDPSHWLRAPLPHRVGKWEEGLLELAQRFPQSDPAVLGALS